MLQIMAKSKQKPLSFSTTMRNPERIAEFLNCVLPYEKQILTNEVIMKIIGNIIKFKLYKTNYENAVYKEQFKDDEYQFTEEQIQEIIINSPQDHKEMRFDKGWASRFDTFYKLSKEFGYMYYEMGQPIEITQVGHMLIDALNESPCNDQKIKDIFLNSMMKYQVDNPFRKNANSNVPLILLLQVIKLLKEDPEENGAGIFRKEISLFICWPNNDAKQLYNLIKQIRKSHKFGYSDEFMYDICLRLLNTTNTRYVKMSKVCGETIDEYIRKMRITGVVSLRGNGRFLDYNTLEQNKIDCVLEHYSTYPTFTNPKEYTEYMGQIDSNILSIKNDITIDLDTLKQNTLKKYAQNYDKKDIYEELKLVCKKRESKDPVFRFISAPARLEFLTSIALIQQFDNLLVKPNYPIDDEGLPTSTAGGDMADIMCYEEEYNSAVEVTLMCGRSDQVNNEIIPIRRHLKKIKETNHKAFSILVAPIIHEDTIQAAMIYKIREKLDILTYDINEFIVAISRLERFSNILTEQYNYSLNVAEDSENYNG